MEFEENVKNNEFLGGRDFLNQFKEYCEKNNYKNVLRDVESAITLNKFYEQILTNKIKCERDNFLEIKSINKKNIKDLLMVARKMVQ